MQIIENNSGNKLWDTLIKGALVFDGLGGEPESLDIAIKDGAIAAKAIDLPTETAHEVIDATGLWLTPGLLDIHTHLDLEVELEPGLPEAVRHGTTTVIFGNCSLGLCFGKQQENGQDPVVDCFTRVENMPKHVLRKSVDKVTWNSPKEYLDHFAKLPLGPNVATFVPHSMLRIEVMGLQDSISRDPSEAELQQMETIMKDCMDAGYLGMSTDGLPFHYLANDPNTDKRIPTQHASFSEYKRLLKVVREQGGVWQTTSVIESKVKMFAYFALTSGRLFGKTLKTSALAAVKLTEMPRAHKLIMGFAKLMNTGFFQGKIHFQALGTKFRIFSDGILSPVFEELESTCKLIGTELEDREARQRLLNDPAFQQQFREDWYKGKRGWDVQRLMTAIGLPENQAIRDLRRLIFTEAPSTHWSGESLQQVLNRMVRFQSGDSNAARDESEATAFNELGALDAGDKNVDANFMLALLKTYDYGFRFYYDLANVDEQDVLPLLLDKASLPGFNDSGAHLTNMAFFDGNLMSLKHALKDSVSTFSRVLQRLTTEPAEFFGLNTGTLALGAQADITIINPERLLAHDDEATRIYAHREIFNHKQMLSRSDDVVPYVFVNGRCVWRDNQIQQCLGNETIGQALRSNASSNCQKDADPSASAKVA